MSNPTLSLSIIDFLALIQNQARTVALVADLIAQNHPNGKPEQLVASTNRLSEIVGIWAASIPAAPAAKPEAAE